MSELPSKPMEESEVRVRRIHRRDINRAWEFLKMVFRTVNRDTVEYQRPLTKQQFAGTYEEDRVEQLVFEIDGEIVGYAECVYSASDSENWLNPRYFEKKGMRPLFVEELAVHPRLQGKGIGGFMLDQLQHLGRVRGCTHIVLEVAQNNKRALDWYRHRKFYRLDAAIFLAQRITSAPELLPPRSIQHPPEALAPPKAGRKKSNESRVASKTKKGGAKDADVRPAAKRAGAKKALSNTPAADEPAAKKPARKKPTGKRPATKPAATKGPRPKRAPKTKAAKSDG